MEEPQRRQRTMLSDQFSTSAAELSSPTSAAIASSSSSSSNLRSLLTVRQEEDLQPLYDRRGVASVSLGTALACEKRNPSSPALAANPAGASRTLLDIIRDEEGSGGEGRRVYHDGVVIEGGGGHKISWRAFKDRLRIRRAGAEWQTTAAAAAAGIVPAADLAHPYPAAPYGALGPENGASHGGVPVPEPNSSAAVSNAVEARRPPTPAAIPGFQYAAPSAVQQEPGGCNQGGAPPAIAAPSGEAQQQQQQPQPQQIRVSLMALLEQTDRQGEGPGFAVSALLEAGGEGEVEEEEVEEEEEEEEEERGGSGSQAGKMYVKCCVCMVRHKGAAFIPCGHTFCRLCSRELWVSRGNCPLCNGFILEILDIF